MLVNDISRRKILALSGAGLMMPGMVFSQSPYPARPVKLISPSVPGGAVDIITRIAGNALAQNWPQPVVVENKPGAGTSLGADFVAKSRPDGYTLLLAGVASHAINPAVYKSVTYDPVKDFTPMALLATVPNVVLVRSDFPAANLRELLVYLRGKSDRPMYASNGNGTSTHLSAELLWQKTGIPMEHVPYKGSAPALTDLLGGQISILFDNLSGALPFIRQGKLKALGVTSAQRSKLLPHVPTFAESGIDGYEVSGWAGIVGPAGVPEAIVDIVSRKLLDYLKEPDAEKKMLNVGWTVAPMGPKQFAAFIASEATKFRDIARSAKLQIT